MSKKHSRILYCKLRHRQTVLNQQQTILRNRMLRLAEVFWETTQPILEVVRFCPLRLLRNLSLHKPITYPSGSPQLRAHGNVLHVWSTIMSTQWSALLVKQQNPPQRKPVIRAKTNRKNRNLTWKQSSRLPKIHGNARRVWWGIKMSWTSVPRVRRKDLGRVEMMIWNLNLLPLVTHGNVQRVWCEIKPLT